MLQSHFLSKDLHALRKDPKKSFFDMSGCSGADSAQAVEQNYLYVLDLCATMAGAPSLPLHGAFKAIGRVLHLKI